MDASTITATSFTLARPDASLVPATVSYNATTNVATLTPSSALATSTAYTAKLATTIKASDGIALASAVTWTFTTAAPTPPTVTAKTPADGATAVGTGTTVTATFSRAMDASTITATSFTLARPDASLVAATVSYNATTNVATLTPSAALATSTTYTANLATTVKASDGVALASAVTWTFTTAAAGGTTVRINSGGGAYTSASSGAVFSADANFTGGSSYVSSSAISGTSDPALYQNERWGQFTYAIPVANGTYDVRFHFVELYYGTVVSGSCVGKRIFGMDILDTPGAPDISNLDICAQVGPNAALVKTVSGVSVTDGFLSIQSVYGTVDDPEIAAIEVVPAAP
jgi:hypothetical protein